MLQLNVAGGHMINIEKINKLSETLDLKTRAFEGTDTVVISEDLDDWEIKECRNKVVIKHKKKFEQCYHTQKTRDTINTIEDGLVYIYQHRNKPFTYHNQLFKIKEIINECCNF